MSVVRLALVVEKMGANAIWYQMNTTQVHQSRYKLNTNVITPIDHPNHTYYDDTYDVIIKYLSPPNILKDSN